MEWVCRNVPILSYSLALLKNPSAMLQPILPHCYCATNGRNECKIVLLLHSFAAAAFFGFGLHILHTYRFSFEIADMCWCAISEAHMDNGKLSFERFFFFFLSSFTLTAQSCSMFSEEFPASHIHFLFSSHNISPLSPPKPTTNGKNGKIQSFSFRRSLLLSVKNKYFIFAN